MSNELTEYDDHPDTKETLSAAEDAMNSLAQARQELESAKKAGCFNNVPFGMFSVWTKQANVFRIVNDLNLAITNLRKFIDQIGDLSACEEAYLKNKNYPPNAIDFVQTEMKNSQHEVEGIIQEIKELISEIQTL